MSSCGSQHSDATFDSPTLRVPISLPLDGPYYRRRHSWHPDSIPTGSSRFDQDFYDEDSLSKDQPASNDLAQDEPVGNQPASNGFAQDQPINNEPVSNISPGEPTPTSTPPSAPASTPAPAPAPAPYAVTITDKNAQQILSPRARLFVGNIPNYLSFDAIREEIRYLFGQIAHCFVFPSVHRPSGNMVAFAQFFDRESAMKVVAYNGAFHLCGRRLRVETVNAQNRFYHPMPRMER